MTFWPDRISERRFCATGDTAAGPAVAEASWWVYLVRTVGGRLYTGIAKDVDRRFAEHCRGGARGAKFFRSDPPQELVFRHACADRSSASKLELAIKALRREQKMALIEGRLELPL